MTFRLSPETEPAAYAPYQLVAYGDNVGRRFVSHPAAAAPEAETVPAFLQVLAEGPMELLRLTAQPSETVWFVRLGTGEPQGLYRVVERIQEPGQGAVRRTREPFRPVLAGALYACESVRDRAFTVYLAEQDLLALVRDYNTCLGYETVEAPSTARRSSFAFAFTPRLGVGAGSVFRKLPPVLPGQPDLNGWTDAQVGLFAGVLLEQVFLYVPNRFSLVAGLSAQQKSEAGYINVRLGVRYAVPVGSMTAYGGLGASSGRAIVGDPPCSPTGCGSGPKYEGGAYAEAGIEVPSRGGRFVIGVQAERTVQGGVSPLTVFPFFDDYGDSFADNRSLTFVVGKRFGR